MKKKYEPAELDVVLVGCDVILTSPQEDEIPGNDPFEGNHNHNGWI